MAIRMALLLILLACLGRAQEPPSLEEVLRGTDPHTLADEAWYGLYLRGKGVGSLQVVARPADAPLRTRYWPLGVTVVGSHSLEGEVRVREDGQVDRDPLLCLGAFSRSATEGREQTSESVDFKREEREVLIRRHDDPSRRLPLPARPTFVGLIGRIVFARALAKAGPASHTLDEVVPADVITRAVDVIIDDTSDGRRVRFVPRDDAEDAWELIVAPDGTLTSMRHLLYPGLIYLRAKDEAEAKADRPGAGLPPPASPRGVVLEYLRALVRADAAKLAPTIDWPALHAALGASDLGQDVEAFERSFLDGLARAQEELGLSPDDVEDLGLGLEEQVTPDGLRAVVTIPGEPDRVRLGRASRDAPWRITSLVE